MNQKEWNLDRSLKGESSTEEMNQLHTFLHDANQYKDYLRDDVLQKTESANQMVEQASTLGNPSATSLAEDIYNGRKKSEDKVQKQTEEMIRTLKQKQGSERRAGYIQATIILYAVLMLGIFISVGLLLLQK